MRDYYEPEELELEEYEPDTEHATCSYCKKECIVVGQDEGIGPYEFWGFKGNHVDIVPVSDCCKESVE